MPAEKFDVSTVDVGAGFSSILFEVEPDSPVRDTEPTYFEDLNLDQLVSSVIAGRDEYELAPLFYSRLTSVETIAYRHEVLKDLEQPCVAASVEELTRCLRGMRQQLERAGRFVYPVQRQAGFLLAASMYVDGVTEFSSACTDAPVSARGLTSLARYLGEYVGSPQFAALKTSVADVRNRLADITYRLCILPDRVLVNRFEEGEDDYSTDVASTFERFRQGAVKSHLSKLPSYLDMNHVEAQIVGMVARLYPDSFGALEQFCQRHEHFADSTITTFDREVQFYLAWLAFADKLRATGLALCYPHISRTPTQVEVVEAFDAVLADKLVRERKAVVCHEFCLRGKERMIVVTGPNQGGKTTFARMVGQLHHLASLGLTVPGRGASLFLPDDIFTHFEHGENLHDMTGKLEDDLVRIRDILKQCTQNSVVIINEIFNSTSLDDAVILGTRVLEQVADLGCLCTCVTFLDELTRLRSSIVSMVSTVSPDDPAIRTFKVVRRAADGLAYAEVLAEKYELTAPQIAKRITP